MPGDKNYKEIVLERNVRVCQYHAGTRVKIRGTNTRGVVTRVVTDVNEINWERNRPQFVMVAFDNGKELFCNPSQLKRSKL